MASELERLGLLTQLDRTALAAYCQSYERWWEAEKTLSKEGLTFVTENGYVQQRPEVAISHKALLQIRAFCSEFGLTPSSRGRMALPGDDAPDPTEQYLD